MMSNYPYKTTSSYGGDGLGLLGETLPDTIKIEHVFTLKFGDSWERPIRKWTDKVLDLSKKYADSFHLIAAGIGSYFFLLGISKIVAASQRGDEESKKPKSKTKDKKKERTTSPQTTNSIDSKSASASLDQQSSQAKTSFSMEQPTLD